MPDPSLFEALKQLRAAVADLPSSTPPGHPSGLVYRNFKTKPSELVEDVWTKMADACTCCFTNESSSNKKPMDDVLLGRYGMDSVITFFEELTKLPGVSSSSLFLIEQKIRQITDLVYAW
jgi:hypothetical protein